jgi:hypothetical protein
MRPARGRDSRIDVGRLRSEQTCEAPKEQGTHGEINVRLVDAKEFLLRVEDAVGRKPVLYSGFLIKQQLGSRIDDYLAAHRLWLAQYGPRPVTPRNWPSARVKLLQCSQKSTIRSSTEEGCRRELDDHFTSVAPVFVY